MYVYLYVPDQNFEMEFRGKLFSAQDLFVYGSEMDILDSLYWNQREHLAPKYVKYACMDSTINKTRKKKKRRKKY